MLIPHSNMFIESMFSHVNAVKTPIRNLLSVNSVSTILKIKSFYLTSKDPNKEEEKKNLFEPTEEHYVLYKKKY